MSIPPSNSNKPPVHGPVPPAGPGKQSGDQTTPAIPKGDSQTPKQSLADRKASKTSPTPFTIPSPKTPEEAKNNYIQQSFRVEALETRTTLAIFAAGLSRHIASGNPNSAGAPILVIHVGSNGKMTNIIPADEGMRDLEQSKALRASLTKTFDEVSKYYSPENKAALQKDLNEAKRELETCKQTLLDMKQALPRPDLAGRGIHIDIPTLGQPPKLSEPFPPSRPDSHPPGPYALPPRPPVTQSPDDEDLIDLQDFPPPPPAPPVSKENREPQINDPTISTLQIHRADFYQGDTGPRDFDSSGDKAILLRQGNPLKNEAFVGTPLALLPDQEDHDYQGSAHSARKALLFPLLMNFMRKHQHPSAISFPKEAVYAYQVGLAATLPNTAKTLEGYGSDTERKRCQELLTELESVHPAVAELIARDITGSQKTSPSIDTRKSKAALYDTLTAAIVRDIERLEMSRFNNKIDVEELEIYQRLEQSMPEDEWDQHAFEISQDLARLCHCWTQGLNDQNELTNDVTIYIGGAPREFDDSSALTLPPSDPGAFKQQKEWMLGYEHLKSLYEWDDSWV
ncbi:hypothetical protein [Endozoicomonas numazuensis]|uniref:Uncharacterized protein n=1 Tax=Endozoicomonas numazuensis TaxID=1137799 RepID=A0A081NIR4_9GAMM|nr:hypothetical protein [Endozoicomonas numazuensis]KEQ18337.1 hypothetical protein GZ78_12550 [Endozoicomonas numazuensis]